MAYYIRIEEYVPLADIILTNFNRDFTSINARYPKLDTNFKNNFANKLQAIKTQEKKLVTKKQQTTITKNLYAEADTLADELLFTKDYIKDAGYDNTIAKQLIKDLRSRNIEGACNKIEALKQLIQANQSKIIEQGMNPDFVTQLESHNISLAQKNKTQKTTMDSGKVLTRTNNNNYAELYKDLLEITKKAQKVFRKTPYKDQYVISKTIKSMRSNNKPKSKKNYSTTPTEL